MKPVLVAAVSIIALALPALAQGRAKAPGDITVTNARAANLIGLTLSGEDGKAYGALKTPLASGKKVKLKLAKGAPCALNVSVTFDDENDGAEGQIDVCADRTLNLTD